MQSKTTPAEPERSNERATSRAVAGSLKPIALDGHPEAAGARDLADALADFGRCGGDERELLRDLIRGSTARDAAVFRRERASVEVSGADERAIAAEVKRAAVLMRTAHHPEVKQAAADMLARWSAVGHRLAATHDFDSPESWKRRRLAAAAGDPRRERLHHQIAPGARPIGERDPMRLHLREVVRVIVRHATPIERTIRASVLHTMQRDGWTKARPGFAAEAQRQTAMRVNALVARLARSLYPVWGGDVDGAFVQRVRTDETKEAKRSR
jgi:hypothetical protein